MFRSFVSCSLALFFFLAHLSGYEDCFHRLQSLSMTGIGHLIRKETDLLSILAHERRFSFATSRKEFDDH